MTFVVQHIPKLFNWGLIHSDNFFLLYKFCNKKIIIYIFTIMIKITIAYIYKTDTFTWYNIIGNTKINTAQSNTNCSLGFWSGRIRIRNWNNRFEKRKCSSKRANPFKDILKYHLFTPVKIMTNCTLPLHSVF